MKSVEDNASKIINRTNNILGCKDLKESLELYSNYIDLKQKNRINLGNYNCIIECRSNGNQYKKVIEIINELLIEKNIVKGKYIKLKMNMLDFDTENKLYVIDDEIGYLFNDKIRDTIEKNSQNVYILLIDSSYTIENAKIFFKESVYWNFIIEQISNNEKEEYIKNEIQKNNFKIDENIDFIKKISKDKIFDINEKLIKSIVRANMNKSKILYSKYFKKETSVTSDTEYSKEKINNGLKKLDKLVGLNSVKEKIHKIIDYMEIHKKRDSIPMLHMVFRGNPRNRKNRSCKNSWRNIF